MTRQDLIDLIAEKADVKKVQADAALRAFEEAVTTELKKGGTVALVGFGTFEARKRKARTGLNPQTKEPVKIPAKTVPAFKAGKRLREAVNSKKK
jgi:DNA-binding protein HU-beta